MERPTERLKPIGFWSYARQDDDASDGRLSRLRVRLAKELQQLYGKSPVRIWQDVAALPPGAEWEKQIDGAIGESTFLIPIVTPAFVESEWCCKEVRKFLAREAEINRAHPEFTGRRRIFPIRYIDIRDCDPFDPETMAEIDKLQMQDFTDLRILDDGSVQERRQIAGLAAAMDTLLKVRIRPLPTPEELAEAQRREDERRRLRREQDDKEFERARAEAARNAAEAEARRLAESERRVAEAEAERQAEAERLEAVAQRRARRLEQSRELLGRVGNVARSPWPWIGLAGLLAILLLPTLWTGAPRGPAPDEPVIPDADASQAPPADTASASPPAPADGGLTGTWAPKDQADLCAQTDSSFLLRFEPSRGAGSIRINRGTPFVLPAPDADGWRYFDDGYWRADGDTLQVAASKPRPGSATAVTEFRKCP